MKSLVAFLVLAVSCYVYAGDKTVKLAIDGMTCNGCVSNVTKALKGVKGVSDVKVNLQEKSATVKVANAGKEMTSALIKAVADAGYEAAEGNAPVKKESSVKKSDDNCTDEGCCSDCKDEDMKSATPKVQKEAKKEMKKS
ncbi:MAG: cation transporter [Bacteroidetes bacterium]|nr:cation transporter [Bacteroidota bacterium]